MKKVIGMMRDGHGQIAKLVVLDTESGAKETIAAGPNGEVLFGRYPEYNENLEIAANRGLVLVEKHGSNIRLVTVAGLLTNLTDEAPVIAKIRRLNLRIVNGDIVTNNEGAEQLLIQ